MDIILTPSADRPNAQQCHIKGKYPVMFMALMQKQFASHDASRVTFNTCTKGADCSFLFLLQVSLGFVLLLFAIVA